jgi:hypothetical protein
LRRGSTDPSDEPLRLRERIDNVNSSSGEPPLAQVFVVHTNALASSQSVVTGEDRDPLERLDRELAGSRATWKIVAMHPIHMPAPDRTASTPPWFRRKGSATSIPDEAAEGSSIPAQ